MVSVNATGVTETRLERVAAVSAAVFMAALALFVYLLVATSVPTAPATVQNPAQVVPGTTQPGPGDPAMPGTPGSSTDPGGEGPGGGVVIPPVVPPDKPDEPADLHAGQTWHEPWEEQVWHAGWTEQIWHDGYYTTEHHNATGHYGDRCNQCGADITGFAGQHLLDNMPNCWSYTNYYWFVDSPAWTEQIWHDGWYTYIDHPGYWMTVPHEGYWE